MRVNESSLVVNSRFKGTVHYLSGTKAYGSRGNRIYVSADRGANWNLLCKVPWPLKWRGCAISALGRRLFRAQIGHVLPVLDNELLIVGRDLIYLYDQQQRRFRSEPAVLHGSRPLSLCQVDREVLAVPEQLVLAAGEVQSASLQK